MSGADHELKIGVIGCGVVGAAIAYRLSQNPNLTVVVWDQRHPDTWQATGAALGVLMAVISPKLKGKHLQLRLASLQHYQTWLPQLEAQTGMEIPCNHQGILQLCFDPEVFIRAQRTQAVRQQQGLRLELLSQTQLHQQYPELSAAYALETGAPAIGAIYSPQDLQLDPVVLTQTLIAAASANGVQFHWQTPVRSFRTDPQAHHITQVATDPAHYEVDWVVLAAGLGATPLTTTLKHSVPIQPVLGQALQLLRSTPCPYPYPVVNGADIHLVPLSSRHLWVGATVEFPIADPLIPPAADPALLEKVRQQAIALDPTLADAEILRSWSGLRPRPQGQAAPIIQILPGYDNVILAAGHYRNGVLLAPITAEKVHQLVINPDFAGQPPAGPIHPL